MRIEIFDVGHGACSLVTSPNGGRLLIDCGSNRERQWYPSQHFAGQHIQLVAISNYDSDHVSDLPGLYKNCLIDQFLLNLTISANDLAVLKAADGMSEGIRILHQLLSSTTASGVQMPIDISPVHYRIYHNTYGVNAFKTNDLSLVLVVQYGAFKIIFPGDLEKAGWETLMENPAFVLDLEGVDIFVASHHGRANGQCEKVFEKCKPKIVIISDKDKEFDSQETVPWYRQRASGIPHDGGTKYVYTTRSNGYMVIDVNRIGGWQINVEK